MKNSNTPCTPNGVSTRNATSIMLPSSDRGSPTRPRKYKGGCNYHHQNVLNSEAKNILTNVRRNKLI